ncbi:MAG: ABC transporter ATP-binding protein/permease [Lachnospiraceae bacterium]|nr:ABC transporter ATP-binding protein/permease [Lachnospiraceae bacterium]
MAVEMKQEKITMTHLKKYLSLFEKAGLYWWCLLLIPCIEVLISAANALFYQKIINAVTASDMRLFYEALRLAAVFLAVSMVRILVTYIYMYQIRQIMARLRLRVMGHLFRLPLSYFERHHSADSIQKLCFHVEDIKTSLANRHSRVINPIIMGAAAIIIILTLDFRIGLMVLVLSLVSVKINMVLSGPLRGMAVTIQKFFTSCTMCLTDILAGIDVIKMFSGARGMVEKYADMNEKMSVSTMKRFRRMSDVMAVEWTFGFLCNIVILLIGVFMSFAGLVDFGTVVAILSLQGMVTFFLSNIGSAWGCLIDSLVLSDRVFEILDEPLQPELVYVQPETVQVDDMERKRTSFDKESGIVINDVIFSYDGSEKVLDGVNIMVEKGKTAALVGESGGGKSTIVKLLLGFYRPDSGVIGVLGKAMFDYTPEKLRENIAYVPQDAYLFTTSIKENIRYGRLGASDEEVMEAARRAYAHEFIMSFPDGYDTMVGERGESLSGGQRQRIAIARAFIRNAPILLLDEATSALDSESEQLVQKGIEDLMGGRTTLVVAHRLSTIEKADRIYVIEGGKICEEGRHDELVARGGVYGRLAALSKKNI